MTNPAISRLKAAMKAAALVNQSTDIAKHRAGETGADSLEASKAPAQNQQASASKLLKGGLFGLRDRLIDDRRSGGRLEACVVQRRSQLAVQRMNLA